MKEQDPDYSGQSSLLEPTSELEPTFELGPTSDTQLNCPELSSTVSEGGPCLVDWCRLLRDRRWSQKQKYRLLSILASPEHIYASPISELKKFIGGRFRTCSAFVDQADLDADQEWLAQPNNHLITLNDPRFPDLLKQLPDPPIALFASGKLALLEDPKVAIVGSRRPTPVGANMVQKLARDLSAMGLVITSGMALGIDGIAHTAALAAQGSTIAVMGCGLDIIYPARNRSLYKQIVERGLILSEYPLGYKPSRFTFPQRNRIVSGLSYGVVIVEAAHRSGTLITAGLAIDQDRELMVVPGSSLSAQYRGSHQLLRDGATLVTSAEDILHTLEQPLQQYLVRLPELSATPLVKNTEQLDSPSTLDSKAGDLLRHIGAESTSINQIVSSSGLSVSDVSSLLLILELDNMVTIDSDGGVINLS